METETMIRQLKCTANKHMHDTLRTFDTNITALCNDVIPKLETLKKYEDTGLTPERIEDIYRDYLEACWELAKLRNRQRWIPVTEKLPEDGTYLCTLAGELVGQEEPFTGMCYIENGEWDEDDCVIAWMPLPEPYKNSYSECMGKFMDRFMKVN